MGAILYCVYYLLLFCITLKLNLIESENKLSFIYTLFRIQYFNTIAITPTYSFIHYMKKKISYTQFIIIGMSVMMLIKLSSNSN